MTDLMFTSLTSRKRSDSPYVPRERLYSTPNLLFRQPADDTPKTKMNGNIKIYINYLDSEHIVNKKDAQNLNNLVSSFFSIEDTEVTPYTNEEWSILLKDDQLKSRNKKKLYSSFQGELPQELRKDIWLYLAESERLIAEYYNKRIVYEELKLQKCSQEEKIKKDIIRSFEEHEHFKDRKEEKLKSIESILTAYANLDPEVGYTQGMNFLVGMLFHMVQSECSKTQNRRQGTNYSKIESEVFWILVYIMKEKNWRMLYVDDTPKLQNLLRELEIRIKEKSPKIHQVFLDNVCISACFTRYFLTIMTYKTCDVLAKKVFETFLLVGEEILYHVLLKVLMKCEKEILSRKDVGDLYCFLGEELMKFAV